MKTILLIALILAPTYLTAGTYTRITTPTVIQETRLGETHTYRQAPAVTKLFRYVAEQKSERHALVFAQALASSSRPQSIATIIKIESNFTPTAVGAAGEQGCGQVNPAIHGAVPRDIPGQVKQIDKILQELLEAKRAVTPAVRAYNGAGPAADRYVVRFLETRKSVPHV